MTFAACVAALAVLLGAAPAALADSAPLVTGHPDLLAAQAIGPKAILACFDEILAPTFAITDTKFFLQGYTEGRKTGPGGLALSSELSVGGGLCVLAAFAGPGDVHSYSRLVVLAGAVSASVPGGGGSPNVQDAVPLVGSMLPNVPGATPRPQLAAAVAGAASVLYTFSEPLAGAAGATRFGFYTSGDAAFHAGSVLSAAGSTVTIGFDPADTALLPLATRFVVGEGAVTDAAGQPNPTGTIGAATQRLDLAPSTGPQAGSGLIYHFDFSSTIVATAKVCPAKFALFDATGVRYTAAASPVTPSPDHTGVALTFTPDTPGGDPAQITLATVAAGALDGASCAAGTAPLNSEGVAALPGVGAGAGATSGPNLVSFRIDRSNGFVQFVFDAPVSAATINPLSFHLVDRSARLTVPPNQGGGLLTPPTGPQFSVIPANVVNVNFSAPTTVVVGVLPGPPDLTAVRSAVGVTVDEGAVSDAASASIVNPLDSLGIGSPNGQPPPSDSTTTPAPTAQPVTPATAKPVAKTCHRVITLHLRSVVSVNLRSAVVTVNGKKAAVSKHLSVTINFAKYRGIKSIVVKIKGRLNNHHAISRTKTYKNRC